MIVASICVVIFFFKQKTAYEMRISDWSSDVCSSDLSFRWRFGEMGQGAPIATGEGFLFRQRPLLDFQFSGKRLVPGWEILCPKQDHWAALRGEIRKPEIGRASCRERVCQYV